MLKKKEWLTSLLGLGLFWVGTTAIAEPLREKPPLRALKYVYSAESNDYFYSINPQDIESAIYIHGYDDLPGLIGTVGYVEATQQTNTLPLRRFYKFVPETDHFYTISSDEANLVLSWGWVDEGIEGYLWNSQVPGTVPVYRLNKWNPSTDDQVHYFATSSGDIQQKLSQGYSNDGVAGYIYTQVTPNLAPVITGGRILGRRCTAPRPSDCNSPTTSYRDYFFGNGWNLPSAVPYWSSRSTHVVSFDYISYNWDAYTGHQDVMLRNSVKYDPNNITWSAVDGVGMIFGGFDSWCGLPSYTSYNRVVVELWRPNAAGNSTEVLVDCRTVSSITLTPGVKYTFILKSTDSGLFCRTIKQGSAVLENQCWDIKDRYENMHNYDSSVPARYVKYPLPNFTTGANTYHSIVHANDATKDFTSYFMNVQSVWQ
ncbi:hypothetical protein ACN28E_27160 [Archangium lansingense]|uniref:hypothetical protein n=1 Tax=Archangium lansingense TaxID=2995310 RepID=UPI003B76C733